MTAALLQITQHAERLAILDEREAAHYHQITERLAELARHASDTSIRIDDLHAATVQQAAILESLDGLDEQIAALAGQLTDITPDSGNDQNGQDAGQPALPSPWWKLHGAQREEAIARLRAWVEQVYRPGYGHLAAALGTCWDQHPLCLYGLDLLMELWSALYLTPKRNTPVLASQAELQTRLLPALADQMHTETTRCQHARTADNWRQSRPIAASHLPHPWPRARE